LVANRYARPGTGGRAIRPGSLMSPLLKSDVAVQKRQGEWHHGRTMPDDVSCRLWYERKDEHGKVVRTRGVSVRKARKQAEKRRRRTDSVPGCSVPLVRTA